MGGLACQAAGSHLSLGCRTIRFASTGSKDGSAKCNAFRTAEPTDAVIGAVYEIPTNEKPALDLAEGVGSGYHEEIVRVLSPKGKKVAVRTYIADETFIDDSLCA